MFCSVALPKAHIHWAAGSPAVAHLKIYHSKKFKQSAGPEALILLNETPKGIACEPWKLKAVGGSTGAVSISGFHLYLVVLSIFGSLA